MASQQELVEQNQMLDIKELNSFVTESGVLSNFVVKANDSHLRNSRGPSL